MNSLKLPRLDTYHLIIFYYVANEKSITLAAEKLCLTQPAVTNHIKSLEKSLGVKLIQINRKRISLTSVGEGLFNYARAIYRQAISAERYVELMKESSINIGVSSLFISLIAGAINSICQQENSPIKLNFSTGDAFSIVQDVVESKVDLAIVPNLDFEVDELSRDKLSHIRISDAVEMVLYAAPTHYIFRKEQIDWQDICDYPFIVGPDISSSPKIVSNKLAAQGIKAPLQSGIQASTLEFCKVLALNGKGISMALRKDIESDISCGRLKAIPLPNETWIEVDAVVRRGVAICPLTQHFISCVKAYF